MIDFIQLKKLLIELLHIDSVSGQHEEMMAYIEAFIKQLGVQTQKTVKGGLYVELEGLEGQTLISAHCDTIGLMVKAIEKDGLIKVTNIGRIIPSLIENANIRLHSRKGNIYTGIIQRFHSCPQIAPANYYKEIASLESNLYVSLDEDVINGTDVAKRGICIGDVIAFDPMCQVIENGYIKSRHLDNKISVALLLLLLKEIVCNKYVLRKKTIIHFSVFEEVGHGLSWLPPHTKEVIVVDAACVGPNAVTNEKMLPYMLRILRHHIILIC